MRVTALIYKIIHYGMIIQPLNQLKEREAPFARVGKYTKFINQHGLQVPSVQWRRGGHLTRLALFISRYSQPIDRERIRQKILRVSANSQNSGNKTLVLLYEKKDMWNVNTSIIKYVPARNIGISPYIWALSERHN